MRSSLSRVATTIVVGLLVAACVSATSPALITTPPPTSWPPATTRPPTSLPPSATPSATTSLTPSATPDDGAPPTWTATASMVDFHFNHTATLLSDGTVLVTGGGPSPVATAELYDPGSGRWTATGSMAEARSLHTATMLPDGKVLVVGGYKDDFLATAVVYDPDSGTWTSAANMPTARGGHTATPLPDGRVLVVGGYHADAGGIYVSSPAAELYDPSSGKWTVTVSMATARQGHRATLLLNGTVLVAGGYLNDGSRGNELATAELYDPSSGRWTATGSMAEARVAFTATLLADGMVIVAGGRGANDGEDALASAELYDPTSGRWTATASMVVGRVGATATLLLDGTVLVAGGDFSGGPVDVASAELYGPRER